MGGGMSVFLQAVQSPAHGEMCCPQDIQLTDLF